MRLDKLLAESGQGSRSEVKTYIKNGQVTVNGNIIQIPETKVQPEEDTIICKGKQLQYEPLVYYMLHKPQGVVSATEDNVSKTVIELLAGEKRTDLFPVGRLDKDTEGLLLITNDGQFAHDLLSPRKQVAKTYFARINGPVTEDEKIRFAQGLDIGDEKITLPAELQIAGERSDEVLVTITEGRYHQVKRMFAVFGQEVVYLKRISIGNLQLDDDLPLGAYRKLQKEEIDGINVWRK